MFELPRTYFYSWSNLSTSRDDVFYIKEKKISMSVFSTYKNFLWISMY